MSHVILVVDDDLSVRASTLRLLALRGYTVVEAATALEALAKAREVQPDVILMDLHMQGTSGLEAARQLKADDALKHIPIVALSASAPTTDQSSLFAAVLSKPCPSDEIVRAVEAAVSS